MCCGKQSPTIIFFYFFLSFVSLPCPNFFVLFCLFLAVVVAVLSCELFLLHAQEKKMSSMEKEGLLKKKDAAWHERYVVLAGGSLHFYKGQLVPFLTNHYSLSGYRNLKHMKRSSWRLAPLKLINPSQFPMLLSLKQTSPPKVGRALQNAWLQPSRQML